MWRKNTDETGLCLKSSLLPLSSALDLVVKVEFEVLVGFFFLSDEAEEFLQMLGTQSIVENRTKRDRYLDQRLAFGGLDLVLLCQSLELRRKRHVTCNHGE